MKKKQTWADFLLSGVRDIVFGLQDGLVSTVGVLTGIAAGTNNHFVIILSGFVLIMVEALSMGVGSFLSAQAERDVAKRKYQEVEALVREDAPHAKLILKQLYKRLSFDQQTLKRVSSHPKIMVEELALHHYGITLQGQPNVLRNAFFMFFAYIIGGFVPVLPYFLLPVDLAIAVSVSVTIAVLFLIGVAKGKIANRHVLRSGFEMAVLSGAATLSGYLIGRLVSYLFGVSVV